MNEHGNYDVERFDVVSKVRSGMCVYTFIYADVRQTRLISSSATVGVMNHWPAAR